MKFKFNISYIFIICSLFSIFEISSCNKETDNLEVNDKLIYYHTNVVFSELHYTVNIGSAVLTTTVSIPNDLTIIDYGHCWITFDGVPTISNNKISFGKTNLKKFTINSTVINFSTRTKYYARAYIITPEGIIYDKTYYFPSK
jgi:hypothetical protein